MLRRLYPMEKLQPMGKLQKWRAILCMLVLAGVAEEHGIAWYRILNAQGKIRVMLSTDEGLSLQAQLLLAEGIFVENGGVCLAHYQWQGSI